MQLNVVLGGEVREVVTNEQETAADPLVNAVRSMTPAQAATWIDNNVTDLQSAKVVLKGLVKLMLLLSKRVLND